MPKNDADELLPPYRPEHLAELFAPEIAAMHDLLQPVLSDFVGCQNRYWGLGFAAEQEFTTLVNEYRDAYARECRSKLRGADPDMLPFSRVVYPYPSRMRQLFPGGMEHPYALYHDCVHRTLAIVKPGLLDYAWNRRWSAFAEEANRYPDERMGFTTRAGIVERHFRESLGSQGYTCFPVPKSSLRRWYPRPTWIDACVGFLRTDTLTIALACETARPRKYWLLPDYSSESLQLDNLFDQVDLSLWALPNRQIPGLGGAALEITWNLSRAYARFYSLKGLRRIIDARVAEATIILRKS